MNQQSAKKMLIYLKGGGLCVPGTGSKNCNNRCKDPKNILCTAMTDPTFDLRAEKLRKTICSKNSTLNPAFHDFADGKNSKCIFRDSNLQL